MEQKRKTSKQRLEDKHRKNYNRAQKRMRKKTQENVSEGREEGEGSDTSAMKASKKENSTTEGVVEQKTVAERKQTKALKCSVVDTEKREVATKETERLLQNITKQENISRNETYKKSLSSTVVGQDNMKNITATEDKDCKTVTDSTVSTICPPIHPFICEGAIESSQFVKKSWNSETMNLSEHLSLGHNSKLIEENKDENECGGIELFCEIMKANDKMDQNDNTTSKVIKDFEYNSRSEHKNSEVNVLSNYQQSLDCSKNSTPKMPAGEGKSNIVMNASLSNDPQMTRKLESETFNNIDNTPKENKYMEEDPLNISISTDILLEHRSELTEVEGCKNSSTEYGMTQKEMSHLTGIDESESNQLHDEISQYKSRSNTNKEVESNVSNQLNTLKTLKSNSSPIRTMTCQTEYENKMNQTLLECVWLEKHFYDDAEEKFFEQLAKSNRKSSQEKEKKQIPDETPLKEGVNTQRKKKAYIEVIEEIIETTEITYVVLPKQTEKHLLNKISSVEKENRSLHQIMNDVLGRVVLLEDRLRYLENKDDTETNMGDSKRSSLSNTDEGVDLTMAG